MSRGQHKKLEIKKAVSIVGQIMTCPFENEIERIWRWKGDNGTADAMRFPKR
jgi:hypothetical protein